MDAQLRRIPGVDAEIWVAPTPGQVFWVRHAPGLFGAPPDTSSRVARWWGIATVTPSTNVTGLSLQYQSYLNDVFHRTRLARVGHAVCMPVVVMAMLAALCPLRLGGWPAVPGLAAPVNASALGGLVLAAWWVRWAAKERAPAWGVAALVTVVALYTAANVVYGVRPASPLGSPVLWMLAASLLQAASHLTEPLPPRVTRSPRWMPVGEFLLGTPGDRHPAGMLLRRAAALAAQLVFGTLDELVASPRLLPVQLMDLLWVAGYDTRRRDAWKALVARAVASGNPALDYIGVGGATPLRAPA